MIQIKVLGCDQKVQKLSTEKFLYNCNKLGLIYFILMPNNNNLINRPFANLQERLDNVQRQERSDVETINRKDMYRAIATYLDSEIYHLILNTNNPEIKAWGRIFWIGLQKCTRISYKITLAGGFSPRFHLPRSLNPLSFCIMFSIPIYS